MLIKSAIFLALLMCPLAVLAQPPAGDDGTCRNGLFGRQPGGFGLATVVGAPRTYFLDDMNGCPDSGQAACRTNRYVITGDIVLTGRRKGGYRRVLYPNKGGGTTGWVAEDRLRLAELPPKVSLATWSGYWRAGDNRLLIQTKRSALSVHGKAYWPSADSSWPGGNHIGVVNGRAKPRGRVLLIQDDVCEIRAWLLGQWLLVADNSECGGANVRFDGVYRRQTTR